MAAVAAADRRQFIAAMQGRRSQLDREMLIAAHTAEPEALAKRIVARAIDKKGDEDHGFLLAIVTTLAGG